LAVDWLRGLAVLVMIQCHAMVLLLPELRATHTAAVLYRIDGLVAPSFILAAGFSLGLTMVRSALKGSVRDRARKSIRRIGEVFAVAYFGSFLFLGVLQKPSDLFRLEILHCIAVSLVVCWLLALALARWPMALTLTSIGLGWLVFAVSPFTEQVGGFWSHFLNSTSGSMFPLFPWIGYALIGLGMGAQTGEKGPRGLIISCAVLFVVGTALSLMRPQVVALYPPHNEWVTSPAEAGVRLAKVMVVTLLLHACERYWKAAEGLPPFKLIAFYGTNSLGGYFFHELLLYYPIFGLSFAALWRDSCGWLKYSGLTVLLIALTTVVVIGWEALRAAIRPYFRGTAPRTTSSGG